MTSIVEGDDDSSLVELLNGEYTCAPRFFEWEVSKETTTVRSMHFALRSIVNQLRTPINTEAEAVTKWLVYKQGGPHRHSKFFGFFRQMNRLVKKYNDMTLLKKLNQVLKKVDDCGNQLYKFDEDSILFMGCAYVRRVYLLERIRETCVKCADGVVGLLELDHWINLSLVIFALCSQIHSEVVTQLLEMEKAYKTASSMFRVVDERFPEVLGNLSVVRKLKKESKVFEDRKTETDFSAISRLLKFSTERMEEAQAENDLRMKTSEILSKELTAELTTPKPTKTPVKISAQLDISDLGIAISREDVSFLNSTCAPSTSTSFLFGDDEEEEEEDSLLMSPNLFAPKSLKKKKEKKMKRKLNTSAVGDSESTTPTKIAKKTSFLASTLDLFGGGGKKKKEKKKKTK